MMSVNNGKVILLTHSSLSAKLISKELSKKLNLIGIVIEDRALNLYDRVKTPQSFKSIAICVLGRQIYTLLSQFKKWILMSKLEHKLQRIESRLIKKARKELLRLTGENITSWPRDIPVFLTPSINDRKCIRWCKERNPDLLLVFGTSILRSPMICLPRLGVLNVHTSLLPEYRGIFSEFWQVLHGRFDRSGVTIHFIDDRVDTGDIILQRKNEVSSHVDPYILRVQNIVITKEILPSAAELVLKGEAIRRNQGKSLTQTFRSKDITLEKRTELLRKLGYRL